jgi:GntR family transcriptional regulator
MYVTVSIRDLTKLDTKNPIPLYHQLKETIIRKINSRDWKHGDQIPSESNFQEVFKVSRATVRRAMELLENEGYIKKEKGRGTFVHIKKIDDFLPHLKSFTEDMKGRNAKKSVITAKYVIPEKDIQKKLGISAREKALFLRRLMIVDDYILGYLDEYIPKKFGLNLDEDYSKSLYRIFEKYDLAPSEADQIIEAVQSTEEDMRIMKLDAPVSTLQINRVVYSGSGEIIEYVKCVYHGSLYRYKIRLKR